jgi:hypothetical protein
VQTHVAVGQCLGDERVGDGRPVRGDAVEILGNVDGGDALTRRPWRSGQADRSAASSAWRAAGRRISLAKSSTVSRIIFCRSRGGQVEVVGRRWP